jgi:acetyltransferase, GNAT family
MMDLALEIAAADGREVALHAQSYLEDWYRDCGFVVTGPHCEEAGIDHVPMALRR